MPLAAGPLPLWDALHGFHSRHVPRAAPLADQLAIFGRPLPPPAARARLPGGGERSSFMLGPPGGMPGGQPGAGLMPGMPGGAMPGSLESTAQGNFGPPDPQTAMTGAGQQAVNEQLQNQPAPWPVPGNELPQESMPGMPLQQTMVNGQAVQTLEHDYPEDLHRKSLQLLQHHSAPDHRWPPSLREAAAAVEQAGRTLQSWIRRRQILAKELPFLGPDLEFCRRKAAAREAAEEAEFKALEEETEQMAAQYAASRGRVVEEAFEEPVEEATPPEEHGLVHPPGGHAGAEHGLAHPPGEHLGAEVPGAGPGVVAPHGLEAPPGAHPGMPAGPPPVQTAGPGLPPPQGGAANGPPHGPPASMLERSVIPTGLVAQPAGAPMPAELGAPPLGIPGAPGMAGPGGMGSLPGVPGAPGMAGPGGMGSLPGAPGAESTGVPESATKVLAPDCEEFSIPPSLVASRRAASEAYWSFEKALNVAEEKVEKAMNDLVEKGA